MATKEKKSRLKFGERGPESDKKLGELALYIAKKCQDDPNFGATKLNKMLWWADFLRYGECGESITGTQYQALEHGPAAKRWIPVRRELVDAGEARIDEVPWMGYTQKRFVPLREADTTLFSDDDMAMVHRVIEKLSSANARQASDASHGRAWEIARKRESLLIPYEAVFLSDRTPDDYDRKRAAQLARQYGW